MVLDILKIVLNVNYEQNSYLDQYRDIKLFYKEYLGEESNESFHKIC